MLEVKFGCKSVEDIKREAYEQGVNDAFDAAHKISKDVCNGGYSMDLLYILFPNREIGTQLLSGIMDKYSPMAIVNIIQDYEENKNKLHVGDVIKKYNILSIVTCISKDNPSRCYILYSNGSAGEKCVPDIIKHKTGEHMTIPEFLEKYGRIGE